MEEKTTQLRRGGKDGSSQGSAHVNKCKDGLQFLRTDINAWSGGEA